MVRDISDEGYEREVIEPGGTVLLLAYAPWCSDCQRILPVFDALSALPAYREVCFLRTDMVKNIRTKKILGVERYPTLCLFRNGRQVAEKVAEAPKEEQRAVIEKLLKDCLPND